MNKILIILIGSIIVNFGCENKNELTIVPKCIELKIDEIIIEDVRNPPAKIYSYQYYGQTVYFISSICCDIPSELYDENCNFICSPDGGITGHGDGQCSDFFNSRTDEKLIWEDTREN